MIAATLADAGPARRMAIGGAALDLAAAHRLESAIGIAAETLHTGPAGRLMTASKILTSEGGVGAIFAGRCRAVAVVSGLALLAGSACTRFGSSRPVRSAHATPNTRLCRNENGWSAGSLRR